MEPRIPVEPISELIERVMAAEELPELDCGDDKETLETYKAHGVTTPLERVLHRIYSYPHHTRTWGAIEKKVWCIRNKKLRTTVDGADAIKELTHLTLQWADLIVCALDSPALFLTDDRLREAYTADLVELVA